MVYQVLKAGLGGFFIYIGIVSLIFFSFPVIVMLGYVVCHLILIVYHILVLYLYFYSNSVIECFNTCTVLNVCITKVRFLRVNLVAFNDWF